MYIKTKEEAKKQATANAFYFGVPYVIFIDTSGNYRVERYVNPAEWLVDEIVYPIGQQAKLTEKGE